MDSRDEELSMAKFVYLNTDVEKGALLQRDDVAILLEIDSSHESAIEKVFVLRLGDSFQIDLDKVSEFDITATGDGHSKKVCDRCFKLLDTELDFSNNRHKKDNFITKRPSCKTCRKKKDGINLKAKAKRDWEEKKPKNYTLFTCPICNKTTISGITRVVLDHNHHTGEARGWICESCNTGIGRFDDDIDMVKRAIKWLEQ